MKEQYKSTRCRLFHSKDNIPVLNEKIEKKVFQERYDELKKICNMLLNGLGFLGSPYGVITNMGFQKTIMHAWSGAEGYFCNKTLKTLNACLNLAEISETCFTSNVQRTEEGSGNVKIRVISTIKTNREIQYISYGLEQNKIPLVIGEYFRPVIIKGKCKLIVDLNFRL